MKKKNKISKDWQEYKEFNNICFPRQDTMLQCFHCVIKEIAIKKLFLFLPSADKKCLKKATKNKNH